MRRTKPVAAPMVARVYLRVSTDAQDLERQEAITTAAKAAGYYVAGIYREKASGRCAHTGTPHSAWYPVRDHVQSGRRRHKPQWYLPFLQQPQSDDHFY